MIELTNCHPDAIVGQKFYCGLGDETCPQKEDFSSHISKQIMIKLRTHFGLFSNDISALRVICKVFLRRCSSVEQAKVKSVGALKVALDFV